MSLGHRGAENFGCSLVGGGVRQCRAGAMMPRSAVPTDPGELLPDPDFDRRRHFPARATQAILGNRSVAGVTNPRSADAHHVNGTTLREARGGSLVRRLSRPGECTRWRNG